MAGAGRARASVLLAREEDDGEEASGLRQRAGTARQMAQVGPSLSLSLSLSLISIFLLFCKFVALLKISRHFQKSPNCACPMFRIYQTWNILVWDYLDI